MAPQPYEVSCSKIRSKPLPLKNSFTRRNDCFPALLDKKRRGMFFQLY